MQPIPKRFLEHLLTAGLLTEGQAHRIAIALELASAGEADSVSGEALGEKLGISRAAVQKHVLQLRDSGFPIVAVARTGYRLAAPFSNLVVAEAVLPYLLSARGAEAGGYEGAVQSGADAGRPSWIAGLPYRYVQSCVSTNVLLREAAGSSRAGTLVVTDEQTGGRGRLERAWSSSPGKDLTFVAHGMTASGWLTAAYRRGRWWLALGADAGLTRGLDSTASLSRDRAGLHARAVFGF